MLLLPKMRQIIKLALKNVKALVFQSNEHCDTQQYLYQYVTLCHFFSISLKLLIDGLNVHGFQVPHLA